MAKKKKNKKSHKKIIITLVAVVVVAIIAGCFIPSTKFTQIGTDYEVSDFVFAKRLFVKKDWDCYYSQKCPAYSSYEVDSIMMSNGECLNNDSDQDKCYTFYISRSGSQYYSAEEAYYDKYNEDNPSVSVAFFGEGDERKPYISSTESTKCYIYGLYCPDNVENIHISLGTNRTQQVTEYKNSNCYIEPDNSQDKYREYCSYNNPQTTTMDRIIFRYNY